MATLEPRSLAIGPFLSNHTEMVLGLHLPDSHLGSCRAVSRGWGRDRDSQRNLHPQERAGHTESRSSVDSRAGVLLGHRPRSSGLRGQGTVLPESVSARGPAPAPADPRAPRPEDPGSLPYTGPCSQRMEPGGGTRWAPHSLWLCPPPPAASLGAAPAPSLGGVDCSHSQAAGLLPPAQAPDALPDRRTPAPTSAIKGKQAAGLFLLFGFRDIFQIKALSEPLVLQQRQPQGLSQDAQ
ncbi:hypothetical protein H1C71_035565 [Ictidomys tridecemlineatus]|nr:hypothetical protein H1C71_035565 [Ictidomys tridecemlineatus]